MKGVAELSLAQSRPVVGEAHSLSNHRISLCLRSSVTSCYCLLASLDFAVIPFHPQLPMRITSFHQVITFSALLRLPRMDSFYLGFQGFPQVNLFTDALFDSDGSFLRGNALS